MFVQLQLSAFRPLGQPSNELKAIREVRQNPYLIDQAYQPLTFENTTYIVFLTIYVLKKPFGHSFPYSPMHYVHASRFYAKKQCVKTKGKNGSFFVFKEVKVYQKAKKN